MYSNLPERETPEVMVGTVGIGGRNPVVVQTMTNTPTLDIQATAAQIVKVAEAGAEIVRMTVQNMKEAARLADIKKEVRARNCFVPLVADVHFNPAIAEVAAANIEKVRINPGNYGINPGIKNRIMSDEACSEELSLAQAAFSRLLKICREHKTALRIGVNHGSLSPRIINRYGNTPEGMVRSAMEFLHFCRDEGFSNVVVSLKSSNIKVMVQANRLMVEEMVRENMSFPLHLGVTEAGEGEDGRVRSAAGIGTLLSEGIGETIRVSLTEDPVKEIPVARKLIEHIDRLEIGLTAGVRPASAMIGSRDSFTVLDIGSGLVPKVIFSGSHPAGAGFITPFRTGMGYEGSPPDYIYSPGSVATEKFPVILSADYMYGNCPSAQALFLLLNPDDLTVEFLQKAGEDKRVVLMIDLSEPSSYCKSRRFFRRPESAGCLNPVVLFREYDTDDAEMFQVMSAADFAPFLIDRVIDGIWLLNGKCPDSIVTSTAFSILQSTRTRTTKTEFISCPSCGRTMFNIQSMTAEVKKRTSHLAGLKIAVMGCIVNGPGEMADADYGYIGSGRGRVSLYSRQTPVKLNIPEENAIDELISVIRENGDWHEP